MWNVMDHHHAPTDEPFRPSIKAAFSNFTTYDAPLLTKLRLAFRNNWFKIRTHSNCCGNHGQPGC